MKQTLLSIVQEILSDMDSEDVNSLSDTLEAEQIAKVVQRTYYNIVSTRDFPEHKELIKLTPASDSNFPTHFQYDEDTRRIEKVWYLDENSDYKEVRFCEPLDFLSMTDRVTESYDSVGDKTAGTTLRIRNNKQPQFYTSFDDLWIVMDSYDSTQDNTLQETKSRAYGYKLPTFSLTDSFVPDLDAEMFTYFVNESKSVAMSLFKGGSDPKVEQAARRQKSYLQNDKFKTRRERGLSSYGR